MPSPFPGIELDLIRRGTRPIQHPSLPDSLYLVTLTRSQTRAIEVWGMNLKDPLPIIPVPVQAPHPDVAMIYPLITPKLHHHLLYRSIESKILTNRSGF